MPTGSPTPTAEGHAGAPAPDLDGWLDLPVRNGWRDVALLRGVVRDSLQAGLGAAVTVDLTTIVTDVVESVLDHADWTAPTAEHLLRLRVERRGTGTVLTVRQPVRAGAAGLDGLPATNPGLARLAAGGRCTLAARVEGGTLVVTATL